MTDDGSCPKYVRCESAIDQLGAHVEFFGDRPHRPFNISEESWQKLKPVIQRRLKDGATGLEEVRRKGSDLVLILDGIRALQSTDVIGTKQETKRVLDAHDEMLAYSKRI